MRNAATGSRLGSQFGHYRLKRLLGSGGFGEVYEAHDTEMERVVAIKLLSAHYSQNAGFRQRLYREARTAGQLYEPHVVPIHRCGEINGQLYIDMRYIEGADLHAVLARLGALDPARAVAIVRQIASALDAAHAKQMVHRDVKPANILLTGDDFAYLVDFGLANAATDAVLTSTNTTIGTFAYMAPERLGNAEVSHHADTYALACVLYECLTGSPPYPAHDLPALITAHLSAPIPQPSRHRPQIPASFDGVIARGMAKNPRDRYASAGELAAAAHHALCAAPYPQHADTVLAYPSAAAPPGGGPAATGVAPMPCPSPGDATPKPASGSTRARAASRHTRASSIAAAVLTAVAALIGIGVVVVHQSGLMDDDATPDGHQVEVTIPGIYDPGHLAIDAADNIYVVDYANNRVLKLPAKSKDPVALPFTGVDKIQGLAVDTAGNVYVTAFDDGKASHVLKLPAGAATPVRLPFNDVVQPAGVAVDLAGNVYVADSGENHGQVLKLPVGSDTTVRLPFNDLSHACSVAVDPAGNVYAGDVNDTPFSKLPAGSATAIRLPYTGHTGLMGDCRLAVDRDGNLYSSAVDDRSRPLTERVLKLMAGTTTQIELPFTAPIGLRSLALDTAGNVYISDYESRRVLKLPKRPTS